MPEFLNYDAEMIAGSISSFKQIFSSSPWICLGMHEKYEIYYDEEKNLLIRLPKPTLLSSRTKPLTKEAIFVNNLNEAVLIASDWIREEKRLSEIKEEKERNEQTPPEQSDEDGFEICF